jgi:serine/threonine protein kinase
MLDRYWTEHDSEQTISVLAALVKTDLRCRFARGDRASVNEYLERFPRLRDEGERVLSLIYEEFCLREEQGEQPDAESFCDRYAPWRDSLASQLKYHQLLSRVVGPTAPAPRFPEPGEHFQEFAIDSILGQGGAGRVYRARNDLLGGRQVALKVSPDRGQEASILGRLEHAHIVPVQHVVFQPDTRLRGLIMPYRPGLPLDEVIRRVNPASRPRSARVLWNVVTAAVLTDTPAIDSRRGWAAFPMRGTYAQGVAWIIAALADAVAHAHAREIHHRDIKPANVLLTLDHGPQLLDFNLAYDPHAADQAEAALRGGTLPYMAPEQLEAFIDPARWNAVGAGADIYSLGLVLFELLTGQAPELPDQSIPLPRAIRDLIDRRADQQFAPRRLNPAIPHALEAITLRCLAHDEAQRYPTARALADDLQRFLKDQPLRHVVNPSVSERVDNWSRRNWYILAASVLLALVGAYQTERYLERSSAFQTALAAVESGDYLHALGLFQRLAEDNPRSPLVLFYYSLALAEAGHVDRAAQLYVQALQTPGADTAFDAWAKGRPELATQFETLGMKLGEGSASAAPKNSKQKRAGRTYPDLAHKALATAIRLGSTREKVLIMDVLYDEEQKDYDQALNKLTALIDRLERDPRASKNKALTDNNCYIYRARVLVQQGNGWSDRGTPDALRRARSCYERAITDLERAQGLIAPADVPRRSDLDVHLVSARIGLGFVAVRQVQLEKARQFYNQAKAILDRQTKWHQKQQNYQKLKDRLAELDRKIGANLLSIAR